MQSGPVSSPFGPEYRPCVGIMLLNDRGQVFLGQRAGAENRACSWQMPQGGIDSGETPLQAAWRELAEETSVTNAALLGQSAQWLKYDLPEQALRSWRGRYKGQAQKWFAFRFLGEDSDIDLTAHTEIEFSDWRWEALDNITDLVVPFKRDVYATVVAEFRAFA